MMEYINYMLKAARNPIKGLRFLRQRAKVRLSKEYCRPNDRRILNEDWDILIILDACRYDMFNQLNTFGEPCDRYRSQASATIPWFETNFSKGLDKYLQEIVYVTGNPNASTQNIDPSRLHHIEEVFKYGYSDELRTTPADVVTDAAIRMHARYPDQRMVVHYMQPHLPFVGSEQYDPEAFAPLEDMVNHIEAGPDGRDLDEGVIEAVEQREEYERGLNFEPFLALRDGQLSRETLKQAYWDNLDYVLPEVERLIQYVSGDIVVTADHGNGMGEAGVYGHPYWGTIEETIMVPWLETTGNGETPPEEVLEPPEKVPEDVDTDVEEQLQYLGYH